jgi:hypothetical protein
MDEAGRGTGPAPSGILDLSVAVRGAVFVAAALAAIFAITAPSGEGFQNRSSLLCLASASCLAISIGVLLLARSALIRGFAGNLARTSPHPRWHGVVMLWAGSAYGVISAVQLAGAGISSALYLAALASTWLVWLLPHLRDAIAQRRAAEP